MTLLQQLVVFAGLLGLGLGVAGLLLRGEWRIAQAFTTYLGFMWAIWVAIMLYPPLWSWSIWAQKQAVYDFLELLIAVECAYWIFMGFPGAARSARGAMLLLLVVTFMAVFARPNENAAGPITLMAGLRPRLHLGTAALFASILLLVRNYRIPLHPLHFAIVVGMVIHTCIFGLFVHAMGVWGLDLRTGEPWVTLDPAAFTALVWWWAWRAWTPAPVPVASPGLVEMLQPWRVRP